MTTAAKPKTFDVEALRRHYPALENEVDGKKPVYLDNACTALKPRVVADRLHDFYLNWGGCGGKRSTHLLSQQVEAWFQEARREVQSFLNADRPNEIVFTSGTTEAVNLVARAFPYEDGRREVVVTELEHNSVLLPFHEASRRGEVELKICPMKGMRLDVNALEKLVTRKTALVAMTHSSNVLGGVFPVTRVARLAHAKGAKLLVDDAQYLSSHRHDVQATDVDFLAFSSHKVGGPFGVGVLYGKEIQLNRLGHYKVGGGTVKDISANGKGVEAVYLDAPMRFEAGVQNFAGVAAFGEAIRFLKRLPQTEVREHIAGLVARAFDGLKRFPEIEILGSKKDLLEGSIVSFYPTHKDFSVRDFSLYLNHELPGRFIAVRVGDHCAHLLHKRQNIKGSIRLSFFAYNASEEVDFFLDALESYVKEIRD